MQLQSVATDAGQGLFEIFIEEISQTVNGVVFAASPAAKEHLPSGSF
jgi:hypothetical protein